MKKQNRIIAWISSVMVLLLGMTFFVFSIVLTQNSTVFNGAQDDVIHDGEYSDASDYPISSITSVTQETVTSSPKSTHNPDDNDDYPEPRGVSDDFIYLKNPETSVLSDAGLMPGTSVVIVKERTEEVIKSDTCTVAFSLPHKKGGYAAITAGHCGNVGEEVYSVPTTGYFDSAYKLGEITYVSSPRDYEGAGDWGIIKLDDNAQHPENFADIPLRLDSSTREEGDWLCKEGSRTGYGCGSQAESDVTVNLGGFEGEGFHGDGEKVTGILDKVMLCSLPGDSGSPIYDDEGIVGILSSSAATNEEVENGECSEDTPNRSYYTPIDEVIEQISRRATNIIIPSQED